MNNEKSTQKEENDHSSFVVNYIPDRCP